MLFVGDDWAEDHHDVEIQDEAGRRLGKARLPEGVAGITRLHDLVGRHLPEDAEPGQVVVGIETDRGPWVQALVAAGYQVYAVNPLQLSRYREGHAVSGAKSDAGDAHSLADMMRTSRHQLRPVAGDSAEAEAVKITARAHQTLVWERTRHANRMRSALREYFPAALEAYDDLDAPDTLELLAKAPDPAAAAKLTKAQVSVVLKRAGRRNIAERTGKIRAALRGEHLAQPPVVAAAYAAAVRAEAAVIAVLNAEIAAMEEQVEAYFGRHPDAEVYLSQPGLGPTLAARVLGEFGDDPHRYPTRGRGRTTPARARSPAPRGRRRSCSPGMYATGGSPTPCTPRRSPRSAPRRALGPTTTRCAPAGSATALRCASSATGWSASCTAA